MNKNPRVMLITGAAGGMGRATVQLFNEKGWIVIGVDRNEFGQSFPGNGLFIQADISDPTQLEEIYSSVRNFTVSLDAVINNAALQVVKPLLETTVEEWDAVMASNLRSVFLGAKLAYPLLKNKGGGAIVNVSSVHAIATSSGVGSYAASKGGLLALTRSMAIEFARVNIRVNASFQVLWILPCYQLTWIRYAWKTWQNAQSMAALACHPRLRMRFIFWLMTSSPPL